MHALVRSRLARIAELCRRYGVRRLSLFGSALGDAFDGSQSDVDVLVELASGPTFEGYFGLKDELEALFERPVDVVTLTSIRNLYRRAQIVGTAELLYEA